MIAPRSIAVAFAALLALGAPSRAQDAYPSKTITMIMPFAAGGSTDVIGRVVAEGCARVLGQPMVVDNRGGAGGSLGTAAIAKAAPDGYTIGMGTASTLAINPATYKNLPFDVLGDLAPIGNIAAVPNIMSVHPGGEGRRPWRSSSRSRKSQPGKLVLCVAGQRLGRPSARRAVQARDRHRHRARALSRHGAGAQRRDRRPGAGDLRQPADVAGTGEGRQAARRLACRAQSASRRCRTCRLSANSASTTSTGWRSSAWLRRRTRRRRSCRRLNEALVRVLAMPDVREQLAAQQAIVVGNSPEAFKAEIVPRARAHEARGRGGEDRGELA